MLLITFFGLLSSILAGEDRSPISPIPYYWQNGSLLCGLGNINHSVFSPFLRKNKMQWLSIDLPENNKYIGSLQPCNETQLSLF